MNPEYVKEMMSLVREDEAVKQKFMNKEISLEELKNWTSVYIAKRDEIESKYGIAE